MDEELDIFDMLNDIDENQFFKDKSLSYKTKNKMKIPIKKIKESEVIESFFKFYKSKIDYKVDDEKELFELIFKLFKEYINMIKNLSLDEKLDYHLNMFNGTFIFKYIDPTVYASMNYKSKINETKDKVSLKFKEKKYQNKKG